MCTTYCNIKQLNFVSHFNIIGAWVSVVVKTLRYLSDGLRIDPWWCHWGFLPVATDETMCPVVDSASKNDYHGFLLG